MIISDRTNIAAGGLNANIFAGNYIEFMPDDGILQFGFTSDEAAATADNIRLDVLCGTEQIGRQYVPPATAAQPVYPDHFRLSCPAPAGERIVASVRNAAAAAKNLFWEVILDLV